MNASAAGDQHGGMRETMITIGFCQGFEQKEHDVLFAPQSGMRETMVSYWFSWFLRFVKMHKKTVVIVMVFGYISAPCGKNAPRMLHKRQGL